MGGNRAGLDFTELLDELLAVSADAAQDDEEPSSPSSLRVDLLNQIERLQTRGRPFFTVQAIHEYRANATAPVVPPPSQPAAAPELQPALDDLFFLDPETISSELGIADKSSVAELDRARRAFAMRYHPDRMPEEMRERAALRMQIANMLIDQAKRGRR